MLENVEARVQNKHKESNLRETEFIQEEENMQRERN